MYLPHLPRPPGVQQDVTQDGAGGFQHECDEVLLSKGGMRKRRQQHKSLIRCESNIKACPHRGHSFVGSVPWDDDSCVLERELAVLPEWKHIAKVKPSSHRAGDWGCSPQLPACSVLSTQQMGSPTMTRLLHHRLTNTSVSFPIPAVQARVPYLRIPHSIRTAASLPF